ncbi:MAG: hypothetical protein KKE51_09505 [Gammaproteobacteria bacterium]|nr:hypothetical protein [Gammaproteobacteria bacterium]MBU1602627.1 hypothetical protein [Gammaproteobacteria bacterium]MBU2433432.1 hypothetical protein [Gammaproteobacteria bacterium]MBU2451348.1 hypothetical protein [Gammaproteobacteria bacterium]
MAEIDSSNNTGKSEIAEISDQLHVIASRLAGFEPILKMISGSNGVGADAGNALEMVAGMSDYINGEICNVADRLSDLDKKAA